MTFIKCFITYKKSFRTDSASGVHIDNDPYVTQKSTCTLLCLVLALLNWGIELNWGIGNSFIKKKHADLETDL